MHKYDVLKEEIRSLRQALALSTADRDAALREKNAILRGAALILPATATLIEVDRAIAAKLIELGWTPPAQEQDK